MHFEECSLSGFSLAGAGFARVSFFQTPLKEIDFTASDITGITVSLHELRGAVISAVQAVELARLLGVIVV